MSRRVILWLGLAGLCLGVAQILRFMAFQVSPLNTAAPLVSIGPLFVPLFSFLLNRRLESFRFWVIGGAVTVVMGTALRY